MSKALEPTLSSTHYEALILRHYREKSTKEKLISSYEIQSEKKKSKKKVWLLYFSF
jgi:hypothetical protein